MYKRNVFLSDIFVLSSAVERLLMRNNKSKTVKIYYIYILKCSDRLLYTGFTNNLERRFLEHQKGENKTSFTYRRRPVELIFYQEFNDVNQAIYFEKKIKKWSAKKKLALASGDFDMLQILSECRNATHYKYKPDE